MRVLTSLLCKVTLSSMILTAPAMITGNQQADGYDKENIMPYYSSAVIRNFINKPVAGIPERPVSLRPEETRVTSPDETRIDETRTARVDEVRAVRTEETRVEERGETPATAAASESSASVELNMVISEAAIIYDYMDLEKTGLDEKAFEYAWRGYHNLLKKRMIRKQNVLSICDFSQPSCNKRMYVIDVRHKKLLYRTYVAHGQNSGEEYATAFSNEPDSYKSSLGFYITQRTYFGRNGLSLRINGVDTGYNDMAVKRNIVLHGSSYVSDKYMQDFGALGTSLGCPALPTAVSPRIIRTVKNGSCLFIYAPARSYLEGSSIINNG